MKIKIFSALTIFIVLFYYFYYNNNQDVSNINNIYHLKENNISVNDIINQKDKLIEQYSPIRKTTSHQKYKIKHYKKYKSNTIFYKDFNKSEVFLENYSSLKLLVGNNFNYLDKNHISILMYAVYNMDYDYVKQLLDHGANIDFVAQKGATALLFATINKDRKMIDLLLNYGASIDIEGGYSPLLVSTYQNDLELTKLFINNGADINTKTVDTYQFTPIMQALYGGDIKLVEYLINKGASLHIKDSQGGTPTAHAVASCEIDKIKYINSISDDLFQSNNYGVNNLMNASAYCGEKVIDYLIHETNFPIKHTNKNNFDAFQYASFKANIESTKSLLKHGYDINHKGGSHEQNNLILLITSHNDKEQELEYAKFLLQNNIDIDATDILGNTALHYAIGYNSPKMVSFLLENNASMQQNYQGQTPLDFAQDVYKNQELVDLLVEHNKSLKSTF